MVGVNRHTSFVSSNALLVQNLAHRRLVCTRRAVQACDSSVTRPSKEDVEKLFARLTHVNKNMRKKASIAISELASSEEIERLIELLEIEDTSHRRAAVQTLGMIGLQCVPRVMDVLASSDNSTVRASCAKALAAVALFYPEHRAEFPGVAMDGLERALQVDKDPVTRLSVVGCLGALGSDSKTEDDNTLPGSDRAVDILKDVCTTSPDMAIGATAVSAMAQIAQNGSEKRKDSVLRILESICNMEDSNDTDSALRYVQEIAVGHIDQLKGESGVSVPDSHG